MKQFVKLACIALLLFSNFSCQKEIESLSPAKQQEIKEQNEVLLPNEILEKEGIRFILNYSHADAQIALKLYKDSGSIRTPITLIEEQQFVNYSVVANQLVENFDFILEVEYNTVTNSGSFDLSVIGYTSINATKKFTISNNQFTTANAGTRKDFIRIRKGINKYSFYKL